MPPSRKKNPGLLLNPDYFPGRFCNLAVSKFRQQEQLLTTKEPETNENAARPKKNIKI